MNVLLLSMCDSLEHIPEMAIRLPNDALTSLAGNIDAHHRVAAADLILITDAGVENLAKWTGSPEDPVVV